MSEPGGERARERAAAAVHPVGETRRGKAPHPTADHEQVHAARRRDVHP